MTQEVKIVKEHRCARCGKVFANLMRLQHHRAAEHAAKTLKDIHTTRDIPHSTGNSNAAGRADVLSGLHAKP